MEGRNEERLEGNGNGLGMQKIKSKVAWGGERRVSWAISPYSRERGVSMLLFPQEITSCIVHPSSDRIIEQKAETPMRVYVYRQLHKNPNYLC